MRAAIRLPVTAVVLWAALSVTAGPTTGAAKWDPIDPKELAETTPTIEKDADAEVLLWDVRVTDEMNGRDLQTVFSHHLLIKIFTDRGRDAQSRVEIPLVGSVHVTGIEGRSVRRDGSFTELKKSDIFERSLAKAGGFKVKAISFVLPADTGGIIEYRWREEHEDSTSQNLRLAFSRDIPVRMVRYHLLPLDMSSRGMVLQGQAFHENPTLTFGTEKGTRVVSMQNIPAHRDEPYGPPDWDVQPWMLIYYDYAFPKELDSYWLRTSRGLAAETDKIAAKTTEIQRAAESLQLAGAPLDRRLAALTAWCRAKIKRLDIDTATDADRKGFIGNRSPTAALAAGRGTRWDVLGLFLAMARAAGLDARLATIPARNDVTFDRSMMLRQLLSEVVIAVRDGDGWRFLDPANEYAPDGHLAWTQELEPALVADANAVVWATTPASPPEWSVRSRTATFRLSEDGTLEGDVTAESGGHIGMILKEQDDHLAPAEREAAIRDGLTSRSPGAEVTEVRVENVTDPDKPYVARYHLKVPGYAQRTGSRLFIQPAVFQKGIPPMFPAAERRYPVFFDHAWKEIDRVRIELPAGYVVDVPRAPAAASFPPFGACALNLTRATDGAWIDITREFFFGGGPRLHFPTDTYSLVKRFFDEVAKADAQTLTISKAADSGGRP